jgi:cell division septum initiation protein DivIVA
MSSKINTTAKEASKKYEEATKKLQASTPNADQAIDYIKEFCYSYVGWVPGGRQYVDAAFKDVDTVRKNHREEADAFIKDAYKQFQDLSKSGLTFDTASKAYEVLADLSKKLGSLAGDALSDIIDNHPQLKDKFGGSIDELKRMGEEYGPEAKKAVDDTWSQVRDVMAGGLSVQTLDKARQLIQEKVEEVKKLGDEAWKKGLEQAKPYLDKNPKVKELVEKNADLLKQGNAKELFEKARKATESGDLGDFERYVKSSVDKAKSKGSQLGGGIGQYFDMIPNGSEVFAKMQQLKEVAENHKEEGEQLLKETMAELKKVLDKKSQKAQEIVDKAKGEAQ